MSSLHAQIGITMIMMASVAKNEIADLNVETFLATLFLVLVKTSNYSRKEKVVGML